jgi:multiple sugar transport system substrate-binding protein
MRTNRKAAIAVGAMLTAVTMGVTGCSAGGSSNGGNGASTSTNLKADSGQTINVLAEDISYTDNWKKVLPAFEKKTGIKVKIQTVPYTSQSSKILLNFSQKSSAYDVVMNDNTFGPGYYKAGYVANLASYEKSGSKLNTFSNFYQPYLSPSQSKGATFGLPVYGETTWLMYRKDLFQQDGISGPPKTMDELQADAKIIKEKNGIAGITLRGAPGIQSVYPWSGILRAFGGNYFTSGGKLDIDSAASVKATTFWAKLLKDYGPNGVSNFDWEQNRIAFTNGKAGMTIDSIANGPFNEDMSASSIAGKVGYAPIPYAISDPPTSGNTNNSLDVHDLYLSSYSQHKDAAYKFMAWATSNAVQTAAVKDQGIGVTSNAALDSQAYKDAYGAYSDQIKASLKTGNPDYLPTTSNSNTIITDVGQALSEVLSGQQSAAQALKSAQSTISQ